MKGIRNIAALSPVAAVMSALAAFLCCLPLSLAGAVGVLGLSAFFTRFQAEFLVLALVLLAVGLIQILRRGKKCRRRNRFQIALWTVAAAIVLAIFLFPQWIASLLVHQP
ncbi:MAG TPA: hypothetical protein VGS10_08615 [Terracidiphilus sp.]|nr:hypothetical protein [Terracidiphilus sp.]